MQCNEVVCHVVADSTSIELRRRGYWRGADINTPDMLVFVSYHHRQLCMVSFLTPSRNSFANAMGKGIGP